ncbi:hypothetical protein ACO0SA_002317 [Hanseniaspora valbyensis]
MSFINIESRRLFSNAIILKSQVVKNTYSAPKLVALATVAPKNFKKLSLMGDSQNILDRRISITKRPGVLARKLGMTGFYTEDGRRYQCTVLEFNNVEVIKKTIDEDRKLYTNTIGFGWKDPSNVRKTQLGIYASLETSPKLKTAEFRVRSKEGLLPTNSLIKPSYFKVGKYVDAISTIKGKGFQGVIKRWHFKMQPQSHGNTKTVRHRGAFGGNTEPARVFPGTKMAGRYGHESNTTYNLEVLEVDDALNVLVVKGSLSGPKGTILRLRDSIKIYKK